MSEHYTAGGSQSRCPARRENRQEVIVQYVNITPGLDKNTVQVTSKVFNFLEPNLTHSAKGRLLVDKILFQNMSYKLADKIQCTLPNS